MATQVIAHRGASAHEPENTLAAFRAAVSLGADGVELDVRATADGDLAVVHDPILHDGRAVAGLATAELPADICVLADALDAVGTLLVNVEIKADGPGGGVPLVPPVLEVVSAWGGAVLVSSFDEATVAEVRRLAPDVPSAQLTFLLDRPPEEVVAGVAARGHAAWHPYHATIGEADVAMAHARGLAVNPWTVDGVDRIALLAAWGVDAVVTNDVPAALKALGRS